METTNTSINLKNNFKGLKISHKKYDILETPEHWTSARNDNSTYFHLNTEDYRPDSVRNSFPLSLQSPRSLLVIPDNKTYSNIKSSNFLDNMLHKLKEFTVERKSLKTQKLKKNELEPKTSPKGLFIRSYELTSYQNKETYHQPNNGSGITLATSKLLEVKSDSAIKKNLGFSTKQEEREDRKKPRLKSSLPEISVSSHSNNYSKNKPTRSRANIYCQGSPLNSLF